MSAECDSYRERFSEYLDGELGDAARAALEKHVEACPACRRELDGLRRTVLEVSRLPVRRAPSGFAGRVGQRLGGARPSAMRPAILRIGPWARALPVAAMFLLVVGLTFMVDRGAGVVTRPPMAMRARAELMEEAVPVEELEAAAAPAAAGEPVRGERLAVLGQAAEADAAGAEADTELRRPPEPAPAPAAGLMMDAREAAAAAEAERPVGQPARRAMAEPRPVTLMEGARMDYAPMLEAPAGAVAPAGGPAEEELLFRQVEREEAQRKQARPAQQVLVLVGDEPAELVHRTVLAANERGVTADLAVPVREPAGIVHVYLDVPPDQYLALLGDLAMLTPPRDQSLMNTPMAEDEFFSFALDNYTHYRGTASRDRAAGRLRAGEARTGAWGAGAAGAAFGPETRELATAVPAPAEDLEQIAPAMPERVNLLVRIGRPGELRSAAD